MKSVKSEKGMLTVEVVLGLTIYMAFFVLMLNLINIIYIRQKLQAALKPVAIQISRDYRANETISGMADQNAAQKFCDLQRRNGEYYRTYEYTPTVDLLTQAEQSFLLTAYERNGNILSSAYMEDMGIVGGAGGIDFSGSSIDAGGDGMVDLAINYRIRIVNLPFFEDAGIDINIEQHACTKLW